MTRNSPEMHKSPQHHLGHERVPVVSRSQHQCASPVGSAEDLLKAHYGNDALRRAGVIHSPRVRKILPVDRQGSGDWEESHRRVHLGENTLVIGLSQKAIEGEETPTVANNSGSGLRSEIWCRY